MGAAMMTPAQRLQVVVTVTATLFFFDAMMRDRASPSAAWPAAGGVIEQESFANRLPGWAIVRVGTSGRILPLPTSALVLITVALRAIYQVRTANNRTDAARAVGHRDILSKNPLPGILRRQGYTR